MIKPWLRFFRVVNLPTVPGDIWVGAVATWSVFGMIVDYGTPLFNATIAGTLLYMYGLADNDIVGAKTDVGRPIPDGQISLRAARLARALCLLGVLVVGLVPDPVSLCPLPSAWWFAASALLVTILVYNRTKSWALMGLCRGLNAACGVAVAYGAVCRYSECSNPSLEEFWPVGAVVLIWTVYIAAVTKYSEGEEMDATKKRRVGLIIGAIVYLQIIALLLLQSGVVVLLAVALVVMRLMKRLLPEVSAS